MSLNDDDDERNSISSIGGNVDEKAAEGLRNVKVLSNLFQFADDYRKKNTNISQIDTTEQANNRELQYGLRKTTNARKNVDCRQM